MADIPLQVISENAVSERRVTPSWSITQLRRKLEPVTGIPPSSQRINLRTASNETIPVEAADEDTTLLSSFPLSAYAELHVSERILVVNLRKRALDRVAAVGVLRVTEIHVILLDNTPICLHAPLTCNDTTLTNS